MKKTAVLICLSLASSLAASGCKKTSFGSGCEKSVDLTAPWTDLKLPLDEKKARVCQSTADELKVRSYSWTSASEAQPVFEQALTAAGYTKDRCLAQACYYGKAGTKLSVHPMDFKVSGKSLVTVVLDIKPDARKGAAGSAAPGASAESGKP